MEKNFLKVLIIDDEEDARDILERLCIRLKGIKITGKASGVDEGFNQILQNKPDIVFLDIQMPEKDGFQLIRQLKNFNLEISVIFVTAHVEYAINAMKVAAFDYLLKPVSFNDLKETIERYKSAKKEELSKRKIDMLMDLLQKRDKLCLSTRTGYIYILPNDILYCQADINYTEIHFSSNRKEVVTLNIGKVEEMLNTGNFFRISRSHLINLDYLIKADRKSKTCELYKNNQKFIIPAPLKQIRMLEKLIHSN